MTAPTTPGWVYVLASARPGVVKIGRSTRNAGARARELAGSEGYAAFGPFREILAWPVADCAHVEAAAHRMLAHRRVRIGRTPSRELFQVEAGEACRVVEAAAGSLRGRAAPARRRPVRRGLRLRWRPGRRTWRTVGAGLVLLAALWSLGVLPP